MVTLVGAGCGAYDLITLRGLNAIRRAEVLVYDDLIDARLLDHASESCEKFMSGNGSVYIAGNRKKSMRS